MLSIRCGLSSDIYSYVTEDEYTELSREYSSWPGHTAGNHGDKIRCHAYVMDGGFCLRANTLLTYCEANRQVPRQLGVLAPLQECPLVEPSTSVPNKSTVSESKFDGGNFMVATTLQQKFFIAWLFINRYNTSWQ